MTREIGPIMQHGYIVNDVEKTALDWAERVGAGPFYCLDRVELSPCYLRGERCEASIRLAFGYWGSVQVELIQPLSDAKNVYTTVPKHMIGKLHHVAALSPSIEQLLSTRQLHDRVLHRGEMASGLKFIYLENYLPDGLHLEVIEAPDSTLQAFAAMEALSRRWDGSNVVRPMSALAQDLARR